MNKKEKVIIVDMDCTLSDSRWRDKFSPKNGGSWEKFHENCFSDKPTILVNILESLVKSLNCGYIISTARPYYAMKNTENWLNENVGIMPEAIKMRREDQSDSSVKLKNYHLNEILNNGFDILLAIDDRLDVCEMYNRCGIPTLHVHPFDEKKERIWFEKFETKSFAEPMKGKINSQTIRKEPDDILKEVINFYENRNSKYRNAWKQHGEIMAANFPNGITLKTPKDFLMYHCLVMDVIKTTRICFAMADGEDHEDSWKDKIVYSAMAKTQIKD